MRKGTIQKIEEEINEKRKMPKEVKESLRKEIFTNIIFSSSTKSDFKQGFKYSKHTLFFSIK